VRTRVDRLDVENGGVAGGLGHDRALSRCGSRRGQSFAVGVSTCWMAALAASAALRACAVTITWASPSS
jgi:hypothetical protein